MNTFRKYPKDWMKVIAAVLVGFFAVMGWHFTETAQKPFWWTFWVIVAVVCLIAWLAVWKILDSKDRRK